MKRLAISILTCAVAAACQPSDYVDPQDDRTGFAPSDAIFSFDAQASATFLDSNLAPTNAISASYVVSSGLLLPIQENGRFPTTAGADANLLEGVGFGIYPNPDVRGPSAGWTAGSFKSVLTANLVLSQPGDAITFCRSFATTCATVTMDEAGNGLVVLTVAANVPDTEIGVIDPFQGISAAVRGTGDAGLTIALSDPNAVVLPFTEANAPFDFEWTIARGAATGSLDYAVVVNGQEIGTGNTASALTASVATPGGVSLIYDVTLGVPTDADYSYSYGGFTGNFTNNRVGVDLSPQPDLARTPLFVYPTVDPAFGLGTLSGDEGAFHVVRDEDAVIAGFFEKPGENPQANIVSTAFNGDDFAGTPLEGLLDQGIQGAGFYPSPSLCYYLTLPTVRGSVESGVQQVVHQRMYALVANGVLAADESLEILTFLLVANYGVDPAAVPYTRVGDFGNGNIAGYVAIGTDYADNNLSAFITTSVLSTFTATLNDPTSQLFVTELNGIMGVLEANNNELLGRLIADGFMTQQDYLGLKQLQIALTTPPGGQDGAYVGTTPVLDDGAANCRGYDCNLEALFRDVVNGTNFSGQNPSAGIPALAAACLWGVPPTPAQPAQDATLTGNPNTDHPAYPEVPAEPAVVPVREQAADFMNQLVVGIFGNFVSAAYGPTVPASNFSLSMRVGDTLSGTAPGVSSIVITDGAE